jgi:hypothetical protein
MGKVARGLNSRQRLEQQAEIGTADSGWEKQAEDRTAGRDWNSRQWMEQQALNRKPGKG